MKTITDKIKINPYTAKIFDMYFHDKSFAVFDIETTGLNPSYCKVILSGIGIVSGNEAEIIQFFADQPDDEKEIIERTMEVLRRVDYIVTYNGKHFDLPFMEKRGKKHGLSFAEACPYNLDLYLVVNGHSHLKEVLPNLKQKSVEIYMGLADSRDDEISGGESVALYQRYMETKSFDLERRILLHNHDDLIQLYRLLPVVSQTSFHKAMFKMGFPVSEFCIEKISLNGRDLHVLGKQTGIPRDYISFPTEEAPYSLIMDSASKQMELIIPCQVQSGSIYFDAQTILKDNGEKIKKYPSVVNGYLITSENGKINDMEINAFLIDFFESC